MASVEKYYEILGVHPNATVQDIVHAYRKKAMHLHPDRNKAPDATQQFILLDEAYNYLKKLKEGKIQPTTSSTQQEEFAKWWYREAENVRRDGQRRSKMSYEEVVDEDDAKMYDAVETVSNVLLLGFVLLIVVGVPVIASILSGISGFLFSLIILFILLPVTGPTLKELFTNKHYFSNLRGSVKLILGSSWFWAICSIVANALLLLNFAFNTLIEVKYFFLLFGIMPLGIYVCFLALLKNHKYYERKATIAYCVFPLILNIIFVLNFYISFNPIQEKYEFGPDGNSIAIRLENDTYSQYPLLRFYIYNDHLKKGNTIIYTFKEGVFGLKVSTKTEILYEPPVFD